MRVPTIGTALLLFAALIVAGCSFGVHRATAPEPDAPPPERVPEAPAPEPPPEPSDPEQPESEPPGPEADTVPVLSDTLPDLRYTVGAPIVPRILPEATGGEGELRYSLAPLPPGLAFNDVWRELSGTPTEAGEWEPVYRVDDGDANTADSDAAIARFTITVTAPAPTEPAEDPDEPAESDDDEPSSAQPSAPAEPEPETPSGLMTEAECREAWGGGSGGAGSICGCGCNDDGCTFLTMQWRKEHSGDTHPCSEGESGCVLMCAV